MRVARSYRLGLAGLGRGRAGRRAAAFRSRPGRGRPSAGEELGRGSRGWAGDGRRQGAGSTRAVSRAS